MPTKQELDDLLDMGILTQEEYDAEYAKLGSSAPDAYQLNQSSNTDTSDTGDHPPIISEGDTGGDLSTSSHPLPIAIGSTFADFYHVLSLLGRGGSGVVYKVQDILSKDIWALKVLWPHLRTHPYIEQHFRSGHMLVFQRNQDGIVKTEEFIEHNGLLAVRMKYMQFPPLKLETPQSLEQCLLWLKPLCIVLDTLHQQGVAHCDIKPANILLQDKHVWLIDFGIAVDIRQGDCTVHPQMGTQETMAPEQYDGTGVGAATDRYALGLLIFQALTGKYPWENGETKQQIKVRKQTNDLIPLSSVIAEDIEGVSKVIHKILEANTTLRHSRCIDFFQDLERCWKRHSDPNHFQLEEIETGKRLKPLTYTEDPLQFKRKEYIALFHKNKKQQEPQRQVARLRIEEIIRDLRSGRTNDQTELHQILNEHKIWDLSPLQRNPFSSKKGNAIYMRLIPDGCFIMGSSPTDPNASSNESPCYGVHIPEGFWVAETPVTQDLYQDVMGLLPPILQHPKHPVHRISWNEAIEFCNAFSIECGFQPVYTGTSWNRNANGFRLLTEAEWEYCALASTKNTYSGHDRISSVGWCSSNAGNTTHPVAQKNANAWGLFDMSGQVEEWCWDYFAPYPSTHENNLFLHYPMGSSRGEERVLRGGSYLLSSDQARCKGRGACIPTEKWEGVGFRIAQSVR